MHRLPLVPDRGSPFKVLCLGAHSDDIEIGCGGTILQLIRRHPDVEFYWVVFSSNREREREARKSAALFLKGGKRHTVLVKNFRESFFPYVGAKIKDFFEELKAFSPDLIFTHYRSDLHQDHRVINELTWNAFRSHLIWEYEIPKYDGDLGSPNCFVPLDAETCEKKVKYITEVFKTQSTKQWLTPDTFQAIMRLRGVESNAPDRFAEAFYCRKIVF
jgi:LmbE family N-acetylglucosaminyl deacetylase